MSLTLDRRTGTRSVTLGETKGLASRFFAEFIPSPLRLGSGQASTRLRTGSAEGLRMTGLSEYIVKCTNVMGDDSAASLLLEANADYLPTPHHSDTENQPRNLRPSRRFIDIAQHDTVGPDLCRFLLGRCNHLYFIGHRGLAFGIDDGDFLVGSFDIVLAEKHLHLRGGYGSIVGAGSQHCRLCSHTTTGNEYQQQHAVE